MAKSYRTSFIETSGGEPMGAHHIFCSWDCRISNEKAADMQKRSIYNELKTILDDVCDSVEIRSKWTVFWVLVTQISVNVIVFGILGGVGYFFWTLLHVRSRPQSRGARSRSYIVYAIVKSMMTSRSSLRLYPAVPIHSKRCLRCTIIR